jgi:hypothetical protein
MRKILDSLNIVQKGTLPKAAESYSKRAWLLEIVYKSPDASLPDIRIVTNVILRQKQKKAETVDVILVRDPSVQMELWPRNIGLTLMKGCKREMDDLDIVKHSPSTLEIYPKERPNRNQDDGD